MLKIRVLDIVIMNILLIQITVTFWKKIHTGQSIENLTHFQKDSNLFG